MSRSPGLTAINCTSCGAGLDLLGGGRVTTHICSYCGAELDAQDDFKTLRKFSDLKRPDSPFSIGQTGEIKGVTWTIIGTLGMREDWQGAVWTWVEHQLYSPTHGYGWLVVDDNHLIFSRRYRKPLRPDWISVKWVETADHPPKVRSNGQTYRYLQTSTSKVTFAEGEFTWSPEMGKETITVSAMSEDRMLEFSTSHGEREIYQSQYLPQAQTLASFAGKDATLRAKGVHALQPFVTGPNASFISQTFLTGAAICLTLGLLFSVMPGRNVQDPVLLTIAQLPQTIPFEITDENRLAGIVLQSDGANSWSYFDIELTDPNDEVLFEAGRTLEFYKGRDSDGNWTEGNNKGRIYFAPTEPGTYELSLDNSESGIWTGGGSGTQHSRHIAVTLTQSHSSGRIPLLAALVLGLAGGFSLLRRRLHNARRWRHSDWSDDE